jgi:hypothetical protein
MNSLSWLLIFANFADKVENTTYFFAVVFTILSLMSLIAYLLCGLNSDDSDFQRFMPFATKWLKVASGIMAVLWIIDIIIPSKQTVIMVAASEVGQRVLESDKAGNIAKSVNGIIDPSVELLQTYIQNELKVQKDKLTAPTTTK